MSLHTVDLESGSDALVPATIEELEADLRDAEQAVYVYVGKETDVGWECGVLAGGFLVGVKVYLADNIDLLRKWVPAGNPKGIVFGTKDVPHKLLDEAEAAVQGTVQRAIADAP